MSTSKPFATPLVAEMVPTATSSAGSAAVAPYITALAELMVLEMLPPYRCPTWRQGQILHQVTTALGITGDKALMRELLKTLDWRGKHEYEVEAIEDVLIKHYRRRNHA